LMQKSSSSSRNLQLKWDFYIFLGISCSSSFLFYWFFNELFSILNHSFIISLNVNKIRQCACSCQGLSNGINNATACTVVVWHISMWQTNYLPYWLGVWNLPGSCIESLS
jgi:hypothetical protein